MHSYGLAASQLQRIRDAGATLTVSVDKVAASGGYMMVYVADKVISAPFAVIGSIGVLAQIPNFHRVLKKNDIEFEQLTAGKYKRTLTMFGENTEEDREKFVEDLEDTFGLFKEFVALNRPVVDIEAIATGETWFGQRRWSGNWSTNCLPRMPTCRRCFRKKTSLKFAMCPRKAGRKSLAWQPKQPRADSYALMAGGHDTQAA